LLREYSFRKLAYGFRLLREGRPKCLKLARQVVRGKSGIEIGGPSDIFERWYQLPIYREVGSLDNCDFSQSTTWANHDEAYTFDKTRWPGRSYFCEGSDLHPVATARYDFLLSSHNLEHFANPVKGLKEWQRVVKPGGHLILILPHYQRTFDQGRSLTPVHHMLEDYERQMGEDDLTHVDEIFEARRLQGCASEELREVLMTNFSHRKMHHHTFDEVNSRELLEAVGIKVLVVETALPYHIILVGRMPGAGEI
jgi:SAM-dependent methyltransferase